MLVLCTALIIAKCALIFDLDDTLIAINGSVGKSLTATIAYYTKEKIDEEKLKSERKLELDRDDMVFVKNYLSKRSINLGYDEVKQTFKRQYIVISKIEKEIFDPKVLKKLSRKYDIYILTDRPREYYDGIWDKKLR